MNRSRRLYLAMLLLVLASVSHPVAAKPVDAAQAAYDRKDYLTALKLWLPRANRGETRAQLASASFISTAPASSRTTSRR